MGGITSDARDVLHNSSPLRSYDIHMVNRADHKTPRFFLANALLVSRTACNSHYCFMGKNEKLNQPGTRKRSWYANFHSMISTTLIMHRRADSRKSMEKLAAQLRPSIQKKRK